MLLKHRGWTRKEPGRVGLRRLFRGSHAMVKIAKLLPRIVVRLTVLVNVSINITRR